MPLPIVTARAIPGNADVVLLARLRSRQGADLVTRAAVSSIAWALQDLTSGTQILTGSFVVDDSVFDSLQTDGVWTRDSAAAPGTDGVAGYNFRGLIPASALPVASSGHRLQTDVRLAMVSGEVLRIIFQWSSLAVFS